MKIKNYRKKLVSLGIKNPVLAFTHGDLHKTNILTSKSNQVYIDFENSGLNHPGIDLSLLLFSNPNSKKEIIDKYLGKINFNYPELKQDIYTIYRAKLIQIINSLNSLGITNEFFYRAKSELENLVI